MMCKGTPDERLIQAMYLAAKKRGDLHADLALLPIALQLGIKETALKNIVKHLAQANFLEKRGEDKAALTARGIALAEELL